MDRIRVTYEVVAEPGDLDADIDAIAAAIAVEQSVEMPLDAIRHPHVHDEIVGRVEEVVHAGGGRFRVVVSLAASTAGDDAAQLMNMVFGNTSLQDHVRLVDLDLPQTMVDRFGGPRHGIDGLRRIVGAADRRPLTCTALKPQGLSPADLAELCETFARAGIDVIKDDHGLADQAYAPFAARVAACQEAVSRANAETGRSCRYAPSLVGPPSALAESLQTARNAGVEIVLVAPMLVGLGAFTELVEDARGIAVLAHPSLGGAGRIDPPLLLGRLFRLFGADAVIFPNYGGRFSYSPARCLDLAAAARAPWPGVAPAMPVPAGGMTVERVEELLRCYGQDTMLLIGGGLLSAGDALAERSREFVTRVTTLGSE